MAASLPLTRARRLTLAIGAPVAVALIGWTAFNAVAWAAKGSEHVHLAVQTRGGHLSVDIQSGKVSLVPGAGHLIVLTGIAHYSIIRESVTSQSSASGVNITSRCPVPAGQCSLDYQVAVPAGQAVSASNGSGDVTARGQRRGVTLSTSSGDVMGSNLAGKIDLTTSSGDVTATGLAATPVTATTSSGDVSLSFVSVPRLVEVTDSSGSITIVLPPGPTAYRVTAQTASGSTHITVPTSPSSPFVITATTDSGDISIITGR